MSIMIADNFHGYGSSSAYLLDGLWGDINWNKAVSSVGTIITTDPDPYGTGQGVLSIQGNLNGARRPFANGSNAVVGIAYRLWLANLPPISGGSNGLITAVLSADNTYRFCLSCDPTGKLYISNGNPGSGGAVVGTTAAPVVTANSYNHIEMKFTMGTGTAAAVALRVNGIPVLTVSGLNAGVATAEQLLLNSGGNNSVYFKDLVVWNGSGTINNDFLGTVQVADMLPNSDETFNWTAATGTTGYNMIDNSPPLDTTEYISAGYPPPSPSTFGLTDLPTNTTSVKGLITQVRARKVDGGDGNLQVSLRSGTATANGADRPITTAFTYYEDVFEIDPNTSSNWTPSTANAARLKLNRTV